MPFAEVRAGKQTLVTENIFVPGLRKPICQQNGTLAAVIDEGKSLFESDHIVFLVLV
ncbi:hypothetical protein D3C80_1992460 [compost metagenome]